MPQVCKGKRLKARGPSGHCGEARSMNSVKSRWTRRWPFGYHLPYPNSGHDCRPDFKRDPGAAGLLRSVGLQYLTLSRQAGTLSGGESQRIRLATQIGSSLMGVLYILDEPSIGLHQRDNDLLLATLKHLRDLGNTLIVVEHDEDTMWAADYIVDIGPGAGVHGGNVVACGTAQEVINTPGSITGDYLAGRKKGTSSHSAQAGKWNAAGGARGCGK